MLSDAEQQAIRRPHPKVLHALGPRPLLDEAAAIGAAYGSPGLLVGEILAAGLVLGRRLWFGTARDVGRRLAETEIADDLGTSVHVSEPDAGHGPCLGRCPTVPFGAIGCGPVPTRS